MTEKDKDKENQKYPNNMIKGLKENIEVINLLKDKVASLEKKNYLLQNQVFELKAQNKILFEIELKNKGILEEKKNCENEIEQLKSEILNISKKEKTEKRIIESKLENDVILYKGLHESGLGKVHAAEKILNLTNFQNEYIKNLEKEIQNLRNNNDETISKLKLEHDIHFYNLKQKMMKHVKEIQDKSITKIKSDLEYNSKLNILYKNEMLNELEREAVLIKELIVEKEKYEKLIFILKNDLQVHKEIEKDILSKNKKYINMIKRINSKYQNEIDMNINMCLSEKKNKKINKYKLKLSLNDDNEDIKKEQERITKNIFKSNLYRECITKINFHQDRVNKKYYDEYISLKKLYDEIYLENKDIKEQLNTLKEKEKKTYNKFSGILNLYKKALDLLLRDEDLKVNNIYIDEEIIDQGNYENFSNLQKYIIINLLIKHLLPLIDSFIYHNDENDLENIYISFPNINISCKTNPINENNILTKLSKLNFRTIFDKRIEICDLNELNINNRKLKSFSSQNNIIIDKNKKKHELLRNKSYNRNKRPKLFKAMKGKYKPFRFIHIDNDKFLFNINKEKDISFIRNNFFE